MCFSLLSGRWAPEQQPRLEQLRGLTRAFAFDHITEHFGFFTGQDLPAGVLLPVPYTSTALCLGEDRLHHIRRQLPTRSDELFLPRHPWAGGPAAEDSLLHEQQQLSRIPETAPSWGEAHRQRHASSLAYSAWRVEEWEPYMRETALRIAQKVAAVAGA